MESRCNLNKARQTSGGGWRAPEPVRARDASARDRPALSIARSRAAASAPSVIVSVARNQS